jgi:hypothetical protein
LQKLKFYLISHTTFGLDPLISQETMDKRNLEWLNGL